MGMTWCKQLLCTLTFISLSVTYSGRFLQPVIVSVMEQYNCVLSHRQQTSVSSSTAIEAWKSLVRRMNLLLGHRIGTKYSTFGQTATSILLSHISYHHLQSSSTCSQISHFAMKSLWHKACTSAKINSTKSHNFSNLPK